MIHLYLRGHNYDLSETVGFTRRFPICRRRFAFSALRCYNKTMDRHRKKYLNTDKRIHAAFIRLLARNEFSEISVSELCRMAGVNRSTFYAHYANTQELAEQIHTVIVEKFFDEMLAKGVLNPASARKKHDSAAEQKATITGFLEFIKKYRVVYETIRKNRIYFSFEINKQEMKTDIFFPRFEMMNITDPVKKEYLFEFVFSGAYAVVNKWVDSGCGEDAAMIGEILFGIFKHNSILG